jgi:hypothetical protein
MKAYRNIYRGCDLAKWGVEYISDQEDDNGVSFEMFNDLETQSTFMKLPGETVLEARDRIRRGYDKK